MTTLNYTLTLTSDGEPAGGFGTGIIDALLPRDDRGRIILPASHLKGIIRENLDKLPENIVPQGTVSKLFGREGTDTEGGSLFHMTDAAAPEEAQTLVITRTALNRHGVAKEKSLRSGEAVARGTEFRGSLTCLKPAFVELLKLGLLSLFAVGGGRNRGAGACFVTVDEEERTPGQVLASLDYDVLAEDDSLAPVARAVPGKATGRPMMVRLTFRADGPVCVPDIPVVPNNAITTGFAVPASAVQGAVLHRLSDIYRDLADSCFEHADFRAWPLHPGLPDAEISMRAPMTLNTIKSDRDGKPDGLFDIALDKGKPPPMKSARGVIIATKNERELWQSKEMGRTISAHGVHNRYKGKVAGIVERNLFTVEALSPMTFTGLLSIPEDAWPVLEESLAQDPAAWFGKARSVRGGGRLYAEPIEPGTLQEIFGSAPQVFIVQSPVLIPEGIDPAGPAREILKQIVDESGMGRAEDTWALAGIRFGWTRHRERGRIPPAPVIEPGSVFRLEEPVKAWAALGKGRKQGFGAIMPHPGPLTGRYTPKIKIPRVASKDKGYATLGFDLYADVVKSGLSTSQISRVHELVLSDPGQALAFLDRQRTGRPDAVWDRWKPVIMDISNGIKEDPAHTAKVLNVCRDLLAAEGGF